jgi:formylglycine-generating enzyme required for sulfatase activity
MGEERGKRDADVRRNRLSGLEHQRSQARPLSPPSRLVLAAGCLFGVALLGAISVCFAQSGMSGPGTVPQQTTTAPTPQTGKPPLSAAQERALKPGSTFSECQNCPVMVVVPAGVFTMGSPISEAERSQDESPQHAVTIAGQFAVGQNEVTFDQWDACVADGGCNGYSPVDMGWGRGSRPVVKVSWNDAKTYIAWLAKKTGKPYRLLSEAEYEYATRAGSTTPYPWGSTIGTNKADCQGCGSQWDNKQTAPVGSFAANSFGLYDMVGNIYEWVEDCYHTSYNGAPRDGSAWTTGDCVPGKQFAASGRVLRGATWGNPPAVLRSADRYGGMEDMRDSGVGFRVARALAAP